MGGLLRLMMGEEYTYDECSRMIFYLLFGSLLIHTSLYSPLPSLTPHARNRTHVVFYRGISSIYVLEMCAARNAMI